jgi:peptidoglycan/LPS O-acetylase OafA/YrhL
MNNQKGLIVNPLHRSFGLDLIRVLAVSFVLLAHFGKAIEPFGFWGVELFFALSGYLIGNIVLRHYLRSPEWNFKQIKNFWARRWWRTLPNYYLFLIVSLFFHHFQDGKIPSVLKLSSFLWFGQNLLSRFSEFYGVSWSLCIEEWLYFTFPLVLYICNRFGMSKSRTFILTLLTFYIGCFLVREYLYENGEGLSLRGITLSRLDAIAYGIGMAYVSAVIELSRLKKQLLFLVGLVLLLSPLIALTIFNCPYEIIKQHRVFLLIVPIGASLILPLVSMIQKFTGMFNIINIAVEKMSLWTYSIYLSHVPILFTTYHLLNDYRFSFFGNLLSKIIGLFLTIGLSALVFRYFESPFTKMRPKEL